MIGSGDLPAVTNNILNGKGEFGTSMQFNGTALDNAGSTLYLTAATGTLNIASGGSITGGQVTSDGVGALLATGTSTRIQRARGSTTSGASSVNSGSA